MSRKRALLFLIPYLALLFYVTLVWRTESVVGPASRLNLTPFRMIRHYWFDSVWWWRHPEAGPFMYIVYNIVRGLIVNVVGNVAAFVPLGFLLPYLRDRRTSAWQALLVGAALSLLIETLQYLSGRRVADVDDVMLNALGTLVGYLIAAALSRLHWIGPRGTA